MELKNVEIIKIGELRTFDSGFRLVEWVGKDDSGQYPQEIQFQSKQDNAEKFLKYNKVGDRVDIDFNLNGRSWLKEGAEESERKWFNSLDAWKVFKTETVDMPPIPPVDAFEPVSDLKDQEEDDLPF